MRIICEYKKRQYCRSIRIEFFFTISVTLYMMILMSPCIILASIILIEDFLVLEMWTKCSDSAWLGEYWSFLLLRVPYPLWTITLIHILNLDEILESDDLRIAGRVAELEKKVLEQGEELMYLKSTLAEVLKRLALFEGSKSKLSSTDVSATASSKESFRLRTTDFSPTHGTEKNTGMKMSFLSLIRW